MINPSGVLKMIETDLIEQKSSKKNLSYDVEKFIKALNKGFYMTKDNHFKMPLPFK